MKKGTLFKEGGAFWGGGVYCKDMSSQIILFMIERPSHHPFVHIRLPAIYVSSVIFNLNFFLRCNTFFYSGFKVWEIFEFLCAEWNF